MKTGITLTCPICRREYVKVKYEYDRNQRLGRVSVCSKSCLAIHMNFTPSKHAETKRATAARNAKQYRSNNAGWKGGISRKLKPITAELKDVIESNNEETIDGDHCSD